MTSYVAQISSSVNGYIPHLYSSNILNSSNIISPYATVTTLNTTNITNALALSTYTLSTGNITSGQYQLSGTTVIDSGRNGIFNGLSCSTSITSPSFNVPGTVVIDSGKNGLFNNVRADGYFMQGKGIKMQCGIGGVGVNTSSTLGYQSFLFAFAATPNVVATMNSSVLTNICVIIVSNVTSLGL